MDARVERSLEGAERDAASEKSGAGLMGPSGEGEASPARRSSSTGGLPGGTAIRRLSPEESTAAGLPGGCLVEERDGNLRFWQTRPDGSLSPLLLSLEKGIRARERLRMVWFRMGLISLP